MTVSKQHIQQSSENKRCSGLDIITIVHRGREVSFWSNPNKLLIHLWLASVRQALDRWRFEHLLPSVVPPASAPNGGQDSGRCKLARSLESLYPGALRDARSLVSLPATSGLTWSCKLCTSLWWTAHRFLATELFNSPLYSLSCTHHLQGLGRIYFSGVFASHPVFLFPSNPWFPSILCHEASHLNAAAWSWQSLYRKYIICYEEPTKRIWWMQISFFSVGENVNVK